MRCRADGRGRPGSSPGSSRSCRSRAPAKVLSIRPPLRKVSGPERLRERSRTRMFGAVAKRRFATLQKRTDPSHNWQIGHLDRISACLRGSTRQGENRKLRNTGRSDDGQAKQAAASWRQQWATDSALGGREAHLHARGRRPAARQRRSRSTRWPSAAPSGSGTCCTPRTTSTRSARSPAARPCRWSGPGSRRSTCPAGRSRPTPTCPARPTPTRASTRPTRCRRWCAGSTTRCCAPTRSTPPTGTHDTRLAGADRRRRRGRLRRPAQRVRADEGDDRGRRGGRALGGPARRPRRSAATSAARC